MQQNYINHMAFLLDESWSMSKRKKDVISVFKSNVEHLAKRSVVTDQETRISIYQFSDYAKCTVFDKDVLRLPSIENTYNPQGNTALIDATLLAISDLEKTNVIYGDHSFFLHILTDGENNISNHRYRELEKKLAVLPDHWTVVVWVPNQMAVAEAKKYGFPAGNIQIWNPDNSNGVFEVGEKINKITDKYMEARKTGQRGSRNIFQVDASNLVSSVVVNKLDQVKSNQYRLLDVFKSNDGQQIRDFIEEKGFVYNKGCAFYELTKTELIQANKQVAVQNKLSSKVYSGTEARDLLGLPDQNAKVAAGNFNNYRVFVQSNSVNRKLVNGTKVLYFV